MTPMSDPVDNRIGPNFGKPLSHRPHSERIAALERDLAREREMMDVATGSNRTLHVRVADLQRENATLREALTKISQHEPREGYLSESDMSHMSGGDDCGGCVEMIGLAKAALTQLTES